MKEFVHLHVHTEFSLLDGACRIKTLIQRVKELGQKAVAITDHGSMYGVIEFYNEALKNSIKPIIGCEVYVAERSRFDKIHQLDGKPYHLVLLCKNNEGYQNLIKLVSIGYIEGFYNKPRVDIDILRKYSRGLIALSGCLAGEVARNLSNDNYEDAKKTALTYNEIFGNGNFFLEIQNHNIPEQQRILPYIYKISRETGIPLVATNDSHYVNKNDADMQRVLLAIQTNTTINEPSGLGFASDEFYIKSYQEMVEAFKNSGTAITNTVDIANMCNVSFEFGVIKLPKFSINGVTDNITYFKNLCKEGLIKRYGKMVPENVIQRLEYELRIIIQMGYVDYFLIVWDFIRYAKQNSIPVGPGRGSGAGSIAAYCIGITGIDPIKYNLLFERFLNPERISMPDFDIDFCYEGRQRVIDYVIEKYGSDHVAQIITFGTMAAKAAIRDVGRAMGLSYQAVDAVAKSIPFEINITIDKALELNSDLRELYNQNIEIHALIDMARKVEGMPRHASTHAAGVVIASAPISEFVPLQKNDESIVTQYTMNVLESLGLLKMDFLGLRNLTVIRDCVDSIRKFNPKFEINDIPLDDKDVYDMLSKGQTEGVFQFESAGMKQVLIRLIPENIEDLIAVISLYRPGPMESIPKYIANRHNPELVTYKVPQLEEILKVTYGCIVYQEQVMQICRNLAGYSYGRADLVRRAMSKKKADVMEKERKSFIYGEKNPDGTINCVGAIANGVSENIANEIFDEMASFASYAFNKSHAAAYAYLSYQTAYLKCHYYKEYMSGLLTSVLDNTSKLIEYISACEENNVRILSPNINESFNGFIATKDGIRFGLLAIKNLGKGVIAEIVNERVKHGNFTSLQNFCTRMYGRDINKRAVESLIKCGVFDGFNLNRRQMMENYDKIFIGLNSQVRRNIDGQIDFFAENLSSSTENLSVAFCEEYPIEDLLAMEKESVGIYISGHPLSAYLEFVKARNFTNINEVIANSKEEIKDFSDGSVVSLLVLLQGEKLYTTRSNAQMLFVQFEDMTGDIEGVIFPNAFEKFKKILKKDNIYHIIGHISLKDDEDAKIIVDNIFTSEEFNVISSKMNLSIKIASFEKDKIKNILNILSKQPGNSKIRFFFYDLNKLTEPKEIKGISITQELIKVLASEIPYENIRIS